MADKKYDESEGVWRTIGGRRVFIKNGKDLKTAMRESGKFKTLRAKDEELQKQKLESKIMTTETSMDDAVENNSLQEHMGKDGRLSPEREKIHQEIIREYFEGKRPIPEGEEKVYYMTGGGSGTGKSNFVKNENGKYFGKYNGDIVKIDADDLKVKIYEKENDGRLFSASYLHEESSALSKRINGIATDLGYPTMLDSTGDGSPEKLAKKINEAHSKGYKVVACYGTCDFRKALDNNLERYESKMKKGDPTARYVAEKEVVALHRSVTNTLIADAKLFDRVDLYDMNDYNNIKKIATGGSGKNLSIVNYRKKEYNGFAGKGNLSDEELNKIAKKYAEEKKKEGRRPNID